ncbi:MAG: tryptophan--tRNA ligase [Parcubacteria group bacterium]|nr:tryptophan--tRNA ligase [Parcubacteria group bacterium]
MNASKIIVSGIQPSGELHIGNYLGAIKNLIALQNEEQNSLFLFVADYHSLSGDPVTADIKRAQIEQLIIDLVSLGIDPEKTTLFIQSHVPEVTELAWILNTLTPMGELERMTQFKDKSTHQKENINVGLFDYPVLQAADILIYDTSSVPVGEDQLQHLELTRTLARKFNSRYGDMFKEPQALLSPTPRVMSLTDPIHKMSKSHGSNSYIGVFDEPSITEEKVKSAVSADNSLFEKIIYSHSEVSAEESLEIIPSEKGRQNPEIETLIAGVKNLLTLYREFAPEQFKKLLAPEPVEGQTIIDPQSLRYGEIKKNLGETINNHFAPAREARKEITLQQAQGKQQLLDQIIKNGIAARAIAQKTLQEVKTKIGLL